MNLNQLESMTKDSQEIWKTPFSISTSLCLEQSKKNLLIVNIRLLKLKVDECKKSTAVNSALCRRVIVNTPTCTRSYQCENESLSNKTIDCCFSFCFVQRCIFFRCTYISCILGISDTNPVQKK